ncbi:MFS transporter [Pseudonocardia eucalypti]|uniref:MFS transporter n=1 Tax=Pseudonocardia eucalypti TaxID=648755 RepID=A0ABP9QEY9_9PSEU|nr:MFS family permease [Pseudonocardia eucalypti]
MAKTGMFASLRVRNYRFFAAGQVVSLIGTWMQRIAQDWLVLDLSGSSPVALGIAAALQFGPTLGLSLWGGVLADRYDKRKLLVAVQSGMGLCALVLGTLDVTHLVRLWQVYLLCFLLGCFSALDVPIRQAFVSELVGPDQLTNAVGLNSMTFNLARIVGPSVAGVMIAGVGTGWVFLLNAASFAAVLTGLLVMDPALLFRSERVARARGQLREGLRYVRGQPTLISVLALVFLVSTLGLNFYLTLPLLVRNVFGGGPKDYGALTTVLAVGSLLGAAVAARRTGKPRLRVVYGAALAFGLLEIVVGFMPNALATAIVLAPTGLAALVFTTAANASVQLSVSPTMRGRVMGLYILLFLGGTPLGAPLLGALGERFGGRAPTIVGGVASVLSVLLVLLLRYLTTSPRSSRSVVETS